MEGVEREIEIERNISVRERKTSLSCFPHVL